MFRQICASAYYLCLSASQNRAPSQIAWGTAIGLSLGLVPKDNLTALFLLSILVLLRINHLFAGLAFAISYPASFWLAELTHPIGYLLLSLPLVTEALTALYQLPFGPWTRLNNTLVVGGLAVGGAVVVPLYYLCSSALSMIQIRLAKDDLERISQSYASMQGLESESLLEKELGSPVARSTRPRYDDVAADPTPVVSAIETTASVVERLPDNHVEPRSEMAGSTSDTMANTQIVIGSQRTSHDIDSIADSISIEIARLASDPDWKDVVHRLENDRVIGVQTDLAPSNRVEDRARFISANDMVETNHRVNAVTSDSADSIGSNDVSNLGPDQETILRETVIEVVRYKKPRVDSANSNQTTPIPAPQMERKSMPVAETRTGASQSFASASSSTLVAPSAPGLKSNKTDIRPEPIMAIHTPQNEESLKYLLWHINSNKETSRHQEPSA